MQSGHRVQRRCLHLNLMQGSELQIDNYILVFNVVTFLFGYSYGSKRVVHSTQCSLEADLFSISTWRAK